MRRICALVLAMSAFVTPAFGQAGPSFDCAKASTAVERTICRNADLTRADREMATLYAALSGKLAGPARDHLLKDQVRWIGGRAAACTIELEKCLQDKYGARIARLKFLGSGGYPFISDQAIVRSGKVKATRFVIDAVYPQFDGRGPDFSALNREFAATAKKAVEETVPDKDIAADIDQTWSYEQNFVLHRPGPHAISVETSHYGFTGGAHGNGSTFAVLVDMRTGRTALPSSVFVPGDEWRRTVAAEVRADLMKQFVERPGFDEALDPRNIGKLLEEPGRWLFKADALQIVFNAYDVGPYSAGPYEVDIPYARLRSLIRADGPLRK